jgi:phosphatidylglycerophosphatase C
MSDAPGATVAAFDLDGTLAEGGSVFKWLRYVGGSTPTFARAARRFAPLAWGAIASGDAADRAKESLLRAVLHGRDADDVDERSREFAARHLARRARPQYVERLQWHLTSGHRVVIVSASPEYYVAAVARTLGAEAAIATRLAVDPLGRLTGGYLGRNCRGEEKQRRLAAWIDADVGPTVELFAYGNSRGDRRMLESADHAFDAGKLGRLGAMRSFERLSTP